MTATRKLLTTARKRLRIARILTGWTFGKQEWFGYAPLGRPLTRRERFRGAWRGTRAMQILMLPVAVFKTDIELGEP